MSTLLLALDPDRVTETDKSQIRALTPDRRLVISRERDEVESVRDDIEIMVGELMPEVIRRAPALRWCQQWGAGCDWLQKHPDLADVDFVLTNASGVHAIPISEHIFAVLLSFARDLQQAVRAQGRRQWGHDRPREVFELAGKTMVLIGVGAIGHRTAELAAAMGMRVLGVRRDPSIQAPGVETMVSPGRLKDILPEADVVVLTVPHTPATEDMIGEPELRAMKPTAYLVNIGRGRTIHESALIRALQTGQIAGAALDVFETEPLPEMSLLWDMDNVLITSHYSGMTPHYHRRAMDIFLDNLHRYQQGRPLRNVVDREQGY